MRPNPLRTLWSEGRSAIDGWPVIACGFAAAADRLTAISAMAIAPLATPETARRRLKLGFHFVSNGSDARLKAAGARLAVAQVRR
jgi:4-hydroxy-2-oxoheptanedioate aldolase